MNSSGFLDIVSGIGAVQGLLFALLLLAKKDKQFPDRILFIWFLIFSFHLLCGMGKDVYPTLALFSVLTMTLGFLHGPFFLLYHKSLTNKNWHLADGLHFIPFLIFTFLGFFIDSDFASSWNLIVLFPKIASLTVYPAFVLFSSMKQMKYFKDNHAGNMVLALRWIRSIALLFLFSIGISILRMAVELSVGVRYFELWDVIRYVVLLTAIGYFGLRYGIVYNPEQTISLETKNNYKNSPLQKEDIAKYADTINNFINTNEAYLDPNFSLSTLSDAVGIPKHHLSQIINSEMKTSFYTLINSKRVEHAMAKLKISDKMNYTLEGIGYESGFNSKSSFFHNFKKVTGKTPKQYFSEISSS
ncbi:helix-turn-helix domain-containing protein [Flagellimonas meridianipacifica]|uniref:AraC-like DNA-binding protein n=1 Tax=Flagellimonas meridianipacifica TaxID=1080225 RepID=A0A2T0MH90_9FLAO|nr:helix-turn-helix domain-containing protein [Allomuricauda pacifica]PRX56949.1 AraC-like DNA-binding protein [Allomuricauda pacifica]